MYKLVITEAESGARKVLKRIQPYQTLLEVCLANNIPLPYQCGGVCHCTTCVVQVVRGAPCLDSPSKREVDFLRKKAKAVPDARLGCQSMLIDGSGELEIIIPSPDDV